MKDLAANENSTVLVSTNFQLPAPVLYESAELEAFAGLRLELRSACTCVALLRRLSICHSVVGGSVASSIEVGHRLFDFAFFFS
eukprot:SAG31_NODE_23_length_33717_cov_17.863585_4_plen_84_part_00